MSNGVITPNEMQQKAIDILKGQVMLLAGPGTGKTFTVINRIEKMLADGIDPSSILCLTYSDAAANEMRQRLIKKMGVVASSVDIYTYHSFCNDIIKTYPSQFNLSVGVRVINDTEKIAIMKECIDEVPLQFFVAPRADRYYFTKNFISHIEKLKTKRITKEKYHEYILTNPTLTPRLKELESEIYEREQRGETRNKGRYQEVEKIKGNIERAKELWALYEAYSDKMINRNLIDFSDMITFVLDEFEKFYKSKLCSFSSDIMSEFKEIKGIFANLNNQKTNKILSNENIKIIGEDSIEETFKDKKYKIGPSSFFQVNPYNAIQLFDVVKNQIKNNSTILDAYGGVGAIGIYASEKASQITLVEENENAVLMAKENYKLNNIKNYEIYKGDACIHLNNFIKEKRIFDYVILDPPRQGCSTDTLKTMSKLAKNIIYVSCNPITLKRDMEQLISDKFKPDFVQGVDLFPYTHHVETVCLLERK